MPLFNIEGENIIALSAGRQMLDLLGTNNKPYSILDDVPFGNADRGRHDSVPMTSSSKQQHHDGSRRAPQMQVRSWPC